MAVALRRERQIDENLPSILVVDDMEANLFLMQELLGDLSCNIVFARSGNEALRLLLKRDFAVMLLDVQMPEMDGYEVARHARANAATSDIPIIFVTAMLDTEETVLRGYGSGAVDFLFKPVNVPILKSKIGVFLALHRSRSEIERRNSELKRLAEANAALADKIRTEHEELERAHAELKTTQTQLVQSAKMAALGELVAGIAHEINNPLAFTSSHLDTVRRKLEKLRPRILEKDSAEAEILEAAFDRLREMSGGLERIRDLVLKLRTFSRLDEGERKRISVQDSLDSILTIFHHRIGKVTVNVAVNEPLEIECSAGLFNQALANLISNALDAMEGEGVLSITAGRDGDAYALAVSDTGPGIPEAVRDRVLEPFFTTKPVGQGTGLGLSITYGIIKKHGGTIAIADAPGRGARVTIRLPLDELTGRSA